MRLGFKHMVFLALIPVVGQAATGDSGLTMEQSKMMYESVKQSCLDGTKKDSYFIVESAIQHIDVAPYYCECLAGGIAQMVKVEDIQFMVHHKQLHPRLQIEYTKHSNACMKQMKAEVKAEKLKQKQQAK